MFTRKGVVVLGMAALATLTAASRANAQVSGHVVLADGPVGVSIVFGHRPAPVVLPARVVHRSAVPVRYRSGMTLRQLDVHLSRIEYEYDLYRKMHPHEARRLGWSVPELRAYVRWLKDERSWLREERSRLLRGPYGWDRDDHRPGNGRGRGRGRGG
jgi:hypothetical protein